MAKKKSRRRNGPLGLVTMPASATGNVLLGAGGALVGDWAGKKFSALTSLPILGRYSAGPALAVGLGLAGYAFWKGRKQAAKHIALGAGLITARSLLQEVMVDGLGLITATTNRLDGMGAIVPSLPGGRSSGIGIQGVHSGYLM